MLCPASPSLSVALKVYFSSFALPIFIVSMICWHFVRLPMMEGAICPGHEHGFDIN